jgi:hypothetical protein
MVEKLSGNEMTVVLVNLNASESRSVTLQAGNFGENRFGSVKISTEDGQSQTLDVNNKWLTIDLAAGSGATFDFTYSRYVNKPTYESPYSSRSDWESIN